MARSLNVALLGLLLAAGVSTMPAATRSAQAAEMDKKAKAEAKEAMRLYKEGRYEDASKIFLKLSIEHPDMLVFVRNLGACFYYMRRFEPALSNLRDYEHRKKDISPDDHAEVARWIAEMERLRDQAAATAAPTAPAATTTASAPAAAPAVTAAAPAVPSPVDAPAAAVAPPATPASPAPPDSTPAASSRTVYPYSQAATPAETPSYTPTSAPQSHYVTPALIEAERQARSGGGARKAVAWILGIIGAAGVGAGAYCTVVALDRFSKVEKQYDPAVERDGKNYAKYQWIGYGAGGALIATALIVGFSGGRSSSLALAPTVGPSSAGAFVSKSF
jgi:tetratricopeptide (TPR) repeat protein